MFYEFRDGDPAVPSTPAPGRQPHSVPELTREGCDVRRLARRDARIWVRPRFGGSLTDHTVGADQGDRHGQGEDSDEGGDRHDDTSAGRAGRRRWRGGGRRRRGSQWWPASPTPASRPPSAPAAGGTLTSSPAPTRAASTRTSRCSCRQQRQQLRLRDARLPRSDGEIMPGLAESWEETPTSVTYTLKDGVTCADGTR